MLHEDLFEQTMFWEAIGCWVITILECVYKAIASRENHVRIQFKVYAWPDQQLLPLQPQVVPSPLPFQVKLPAFAHGMIAEIAIPGVRVASGDSILRKDRSCPRLKNTGEKQQNFTYHTFPSREDKPSESFAASRCRLDEEQCFSKCEAWKVLRDSS